MLTELQKRKLTKFFSMYDNRCDGVLICQDFESLIKKIANLKNLGLRSPKYYALQDQLMRKWNDLQNEADVNRDQKVSLEEWLNYYSSVLSDKERYHQTLRSLKATMFDAFDDDNNGKISQQEWAQLLSVYNISPVYAELVFPQLDANHDGFLTKDEMLHLIYDFFYSDDPTAIANSMFGPY